MTRRDNLLCSIESSAAYIAENLNAQVVNDIFFRYQVNDLNFATEEILEMIFSELLLIEADI